MARARLLKPGFFANDALCTLQPFARLLFAGLWTIADREGRLEDRPIRIRAELFPYDEVDIEELLNLLQCSGFVVRYESGGVRYVQIVKFLKHQNPHVREPKSTIPAPGQHNASTVPEQVKHDPGPAVAVAVAVVDPVTDPESVMDPDPVTVAAAAAAASRSHSRTPAAAAARTGNDGLDFLLTKFPKAMLTDDLRQELSDLADEFDLEALRSGVSSCKRTGVMPYPSHLRQWMPVVDTLRYR